MANPAEEGEILSSNSSEEAAQVNAPANIQFDEIISKRHGQEGKSLLTLNGFEYSFDKSSKANDMHEFWRCKIKNPYCPARITVSRAWQQNDQGKRFKIGHFNNQNHNHPSRIGNIMVREAEERLRREAAQPNPKRTRNVVAEARSSIPLDVRVSVESRTPSSSAMYRTYNWHKSNARRIQGDEGLDVADPRDIQIPAYLEEFGLIFNENVNGQKMLVLMTHFGAQLLRTATEVSIDGTFDKVPNGFNQLYTLAVIIDRCAIPVVFGILPAKSVAVYTAFFGSIRQAMPQFLPTTIISDFESSALRAFNALYPHCVQAGCVWHFGEAIGRNVRHHTNMRRIWDVNIDRCNEIQREEKLRLKSFKAIPYVPLDSTYEYFCVLVASFQPNNEIFEFLQYYILTWFGGVFVMAQPPIQPHHNPEINNGFGVDRWIRGWINNERIAHRHALFDPVIWNVSDRLQNNLSRTNNSIEAWHLQWNSKFRENSPRLSSVIRAIMEENNIFQNMVEEYMAAPAQGIRGRGLDRRAANIQQDENLLAIFNSRLQYEPLDYLRAISYHLP